MYQPPRASEAWQQIYLRFHDWGTAEQQAARQLAPILTDAVATRAISRWAFTRKHPHWRLRYQPTDERAPDPLRTQLDDLTAAGHIAGYTTGTYEPETRAFGGPSAMDLAHALFHSDSDHALNYHAVRTTDHRAEISLLLCRHLLDGANQDWYEQGDVWDRVAATRHPPAVNRHRDAAPQTVLRRFLTVDLGEAEAMFTNGPLPTATAWASAFTRTGRALADLAVGGQLHRGLRAVLAHHILFHWNRLGLTHETQAHLAHTSAAVIFGDQPNDQQRAHQCTIRR